MRRNIPPTQFFVELTKKHADTSIQHYLNEENRNDPVWHITALGRRLKVYQFTKEEIERILSDEDFQGQCNYFIETEGVLEQLEINNLKALFRGEERSIVPSKAHKNAAARRPPGPVRVKRKV